MPSHGPNDLQVRTYDHREPGGQQVVETASGVSVFDRTHHIGVIVSTEKSQLRNRQEAEELLADLLDAIDRSQRA